VVEQAAGRGDQHVEAASQHVDLRAMRDAADDDADARAHELAIGAETVGDLRRELARRGQHQGAGREGRRAAAVRQQPAENGQRESGGLSGAGLGDAEKVAALEEQGDRLGLNGGRRFIAFAIEGAKERLGEAEIGEFRHDVFQKRSPAPALEGARPVDPE
jgi:hypothetical protein